MFLKKRLRFLKSTFRGTISEVWPLRTAYNSSSVIPPHFHRNILILSGPWDSGRASHVIILESLALARNYSISRWFIARTKIETAFIFWGCLGVIGARPREFFSRVIEHRCILWIGAHRVLSISLFYCCHFRVVGGRAWYTSLSGWVLLYVHLHTY